MAGVGRNLTCLSTLMPSPTTPPCVPSDRPAWRRRRAWRCPAGAGGAPLDGLLSSLRAVAGVLSRRHSRVLLPLSRAAGCAAGARRTAVVESVCLQRHSTPGRRPDGALRPRQLALLRVAGGRRAELQHPVPVQYRRRGDVLAAADARPAAAAGVCRRGHVHVLRRADGSRRAPVDSGRRGADAVGAGVRRAGVPRATGTRVRTVRGVMACAVARRLRLP